MRNILLKSLLLISFLLAFQPDAMPQHPYSVSGWVIDAETREPLAFVNIIQTGTKTGISTDIDGKFTLKSDRPIDAIWLTYVGYFPLQYSIPYGEVDKILIKLQRKTFDLNEVVILPTANPAHRIIDSVLANRYRNDPEKLASFSYTSYEKTILTAKLDTMMRVGKDSTGNWYSDTLIMEPDTAVMMTDTTLSDTALAEMKEFFDKQDIAIMESVVERKFMAPDRNYENVKANRVSGFQDPIFVFLVSQIQSTSFYKEFFNILNKSYINPISEGSKNKYIFIIEDTLYTERSDTVFIISYRPKPNTNFDGMEGVLYINTYKWAIQNAIARPARQEGFSIKIQQKYDLIDDTQWFPVQLNTDVIFARMQVAAGEARALLVGIGKSYIRDIVINPELVRRQFATLGVDVDPDSHEKPDDFWNAYRIDTLTDRDRRTYEFLDSIGKEANFDRIAQSFETLMSGRIPWKIIDIDLDRIIKYNDYQGIYLGLGAHTNDKVSRYFKIGGYWGYGFKDKSAKYGGDVSVVLNRRHEVTWGAQYTYDLAESGGVRFFDDTDNFLTGENWRNFLVNRENPVRNLGTTLGFRLLRDFKFGLGFRMITKEASDGYRYRIAEGEGTTVSLDEFRFTQVTAGFRFAFREQFIVTKRARMSLGTKYPVLWLEYTRGINGLLDGEFAYNRLDAKIEKSFYTKYIGKTSLLLRAGYIDRGIPATDLFNGNGSYRFLTIFADNSFGTMRMNEFLSDRYAALYFTHNFGKLLKRWEKFQPEFVITTNAAFGWLKHNDNHLGINYKTMERGYYESGFLVNNLLNLQVYSLGIGASYRWGPYSYPLFKDNIALKISLVFPMGSLSVGN
ncbi:MAG: DUF5686 family protein [Bacteroidales bacterium]|jgi:hypothetical protein|nr:DUF5686 family protein [Bacteroidales bacterium]